MSEKHKYNYIIDNDAIATLLAGGHVTFDLPLKVDGKPVQVMLRPEPLFMQE